MKLFLKNIIPSLIFITSLLWNGAGGEAFSQNKSDKISGKANWSGQNPFEQKVFIKNEGQFDNQVADQTINYSTSTEGVKIYFTNSGLTYRYDKRVPLNEAGTEKIGKLFGRIIFGKKNKNQKAESEAEERHTKILPQSLTLEWIAANKNVKIIAENQVSFYYTYSSACSKDKKTCIKAQAFKKLIYKDLYPNIDLEYIIPKDSVGIEYSFVVHPGGDISQIQMKYNGEEAIGINNQNLEIKSPFGLFTDHAPLAYYADNREKINSGFKMNNKNTIGFTLNNSSNNSRISNRTIILDPWTATPTITNSKAFDIDYDSIGNVYIGGGQQQVAKYNNTGTLQWIFSLTIPAGIYSDFAVDEQTSEVYMFDFTAYTSMDTYKINPAGTQSGFGSAPIAELEAWRAQFDCHDNQIIVAGGNAAGGTQAFTVDKVNLANVVPKNVLNESDGCHDMALLAIDDDGGSCYMLSTHSACGNAALHDNEIVKCPLPNLVPSGITINSGFTFSEVFYLNPHYTPPALGGTSHGFNGMQVRGCYLYGYDGATIKIWDKHTGTLVQTISVGGGLFDSGGLDVDECGNIYAGNGSTIKIYNASYTLSNTLTVNGTIYDLKLGLNNKLYACGDGFVQSIDLTGNVIQLNASLIDAACNGCNGSANAQMVCNNIATPSTCIKYLWSTGDTTQVVNNLCAGVYTVSVHTAGCGGTVYVDTIHILSGIPPVVTASHNDTICIGQSANISASGGVTYKWKPGGSLNDSTIANPIASPIVTTKYIVSGYNAAGCADKDSVTIYVDPPIHLAKTAIDVTCHGACNGQTIVIPSGGTAPYTYHWTGGCITPSCNNLCPGSYSLTVTDLWGCTAVIDTIVAEPTALAASLVNFTPASCHGVCDGTATATASGGTPGGSGYSYSWNTVPVQTTAIATGLCAATYICKVTDSHNCIDTTIVTITEPPPLVIAPFSPASVCANGATTLIAVASGGNGGYNYVWDAPGSPAFANTASVTVNPSSTTTYTVNATDVNGCVAPPVTVTLYPLPNVVFNTSSTQGCEPVCVNFTDASTISSGSIVAWNWNFGDGSTHSTLQNPEHCFNTPGQYSITQTVTSNNGCISTFTNINMVTVFANPVAAFSPTPNPADILDPTVTMINQSSSDVNYCHWVFGDSTILTTGNISSPVHVYPNKETSNYWVTLIVHNANGCADTVAHEIFIGPAFTFFIPNAFTPNGDKINDYFFGSGIGIAKYDLWIFDRWGNLIFHGADLNDKWDGRANGGDNEAQIDVYVWKVELIDVFNKKHNYIGTVTLVK